MSARAIARRALVARRQPARSCGCTAAASARRATGRVTRPLWYSLGGKNREVLLEIVKRFHAAQDEVRVEPVYQGDYFESLAKLRTAIAAKAAPALSHVVAEVVPVPRARGHARAARRLSGHEGRSRLRRRRSAQAGRVPRRRRAAALRHAAQSLDAAHVLQRRASSRRRASRRRRRGTSSSTCARALHAARRRTLGPRSADRMVVLGRARRPGRGRGLRRGGAPDARRRGRRARAAALAGPRSIARR